MSDGTHNGVFAGSRINEKTIRTSWFEFSLIRDYLEIVRINVVTNDIVKITVTMAGLILALLKSDRPALLKQLRAFDSSRQVLRSPLRRAHRPFFL